MVILCMFATGLAYPQAKEAKPVLAVLDFELSGVSAQESVIFVDSITSYVVETQRYRVIDRSQRKNLLKEIEFANSDCTDEGCLIRIGKMLSANNIIVGSLGKIASRYLLTIRLLNVETGEAVQSVTERYVSLNDLIDNSKVLTYKLVGAPMTNPAVAASAGNPATDTESKPDPKGETKSRYELLQALDNREYRDGEKAKQLSPLLKNLPESEKESLYKKYALSWAIWPAMGNTLYGLGSWLQGDVGGGLLCSGLMVGGLVIAGISGSVDSSVTGVFAGVGTCSLMAGMIAGWILPFVFESDNNTKLKFTLQYIP